MLYLMGITDITCYIPAIFKFDVWTPWGWYRRVETCNSSDKTILSYINNRPTRCNTKQSIYYSASSLYMFRVSTTPIIRSTHNCNYSLRYWSYFLCSYLSPTWSRSSLATLEGGSCTVSEAVVTVLCIPDDRCGWHPKHVEWTCRIINKTALFCISLDDY